MENAKRKEIAVCMFMCKWLEKPAEPKKNKKALL
jgi:hypothetical protein